ncbi:hypothetical protein U1Q18_006197 [Sarracenia purpurea var. burkii]
MRMMCKSLWTSAIAYGGFDCLKGMQLQSSTCINASVYGGGGSRVVLLGLLGYEGLLWCKSAAGLRCGLGEGWACYCYCCYGSVGEHGLWVRCILAWLLQWLCGEGWAISLSWGMMGSCNPMLGSVLVCMVVVVAGLFFWVSWGMRGLLWCNSAAGLGPLLQWGGGRAWVVGEEQFGLVAAIPANAYTPAIEGLLMLLLMVLYAAAHGLGLKECCLKDCCCSWSGMA